MEMVETNTPDPSMEKNQGDDKQTNNNIIHGRAQGLSRTAGTDSIRVNMNQPKEIYNKDYSKDYSKDFI